MAAPRFACIVALLAALPQPCAANDLETPDILVEATQEQDFPVGRLDESVVPQAYRLDLTIDPSQARFSGRTEIEVVLARPARFVDMHGRNLAVGSVVAIAGGLRHEGRWRQLDDSGVARISFDRDLPAGPVTLAFRYDAPFNDSPAGLFRVKVGEDWYSWSQFQSIDARAAFPSFDQPSFKTPFAITLRTPEGLTAVSNAPEIETGIEGGLAVHRYAPTLPLPTYLVAMMVGPFVSDDGAVPPTAQRTEPLPLRILSTRPNAGKLSFALEGSKGIVRHLEAFFGDTFPYPKLDQITSPVMPGAMENAGADLYRDALIVMDEDAPTPQQRRFGMVVAHELGHQWFGDLVTPAWWDDIWLNESFANWIGYYIGDAWRPDLNIGAGALAEGFEAMETDALVAGRAIRQPIETNAQIDAAFDSITYGKGGHVIAMIAAFMGEERFRDGVRQYLSAHRYSTATSSDFFGALASAAGDDRIVAAMKGFVEQQGVPLLTFQRKGNRYTVGQLRYAPLGADVPLTRWQVPLCVRKGSEKQCHLLTDESLTFSMDGTEPLVPNAGGTGYYRFELPRRHWNALISRARYLTGGEAQAVVDSLNASVLAGRGNVGELARLARNLIRHPDSYAADAAVDAMAALVAAGHVDWEGRKGWRRFRSRLYLPLLRKYGFDPRSGAYAHETRERTQRRAQVVRKLIDTPRAGKLRRQLTEATVAYLGGDGSALDAAWFGPAFDLHLHLGGSGAARALMERALASEDPVFRPAALNAIAQSGDVGVARWLLEELDDPRVRANERQSFLGGVMARDATRDIGYRWMMDNLDALTAGGNGIFFAARLPGLLSHFCSVEKAEQIVHDLRPRFAGTPGELEFDRSAERVRNCGVLGRQRGSELSKGFAKLR